MMFVKICANTNLEDALLAEELGADAVGFVFAESKRKVNAEQVAAITRELPESVAKVGVFTSTDADEILQTAKAAGLTAVQLHSDFDSNLVDEIVAGSGGRMRVLQVIDVPEDASMADLESALHATLLHPSIEAALLDASHGGTSGGTGKTFDWDATAAMVRRVANETGGRVIVAGGLRAGNVSDAISAFQPWGVDVASGVEATPGKKDAAKLREFLAASKS
jgi:phosphoribosylanthranilate isomerase